MKKITLLVLLLALSAAVHAQQIKWVKDSLLTWKNFKGIADATIPAQALTSCRVNYKYQWEVHDNVYTLTFTMISGFDESRSWYVDGKQTPKLLAHEQLHFDIHELYARKIYAGLNQYKYTGNHGDEAQSVLRHFLIELHSVQAQYDEESEHSQNRSKQLAWEKKIHGQLNNTPPYPSQ